MANARSAIEWTDRTWNPTTGCNKVSPGCKFCYAEAITKRFKQNFPEGFRFVIHPDRLDEPRRWKKSSRIFVNSMSDLFHEDMPIDFLKRIFNVMEECPQHVFQILTKRSKRMVDIAAEHILNWPPNVWVGVSVETQNYVHRIDHLRQIPANVRFLSCEPLLGPLELNLDGIHWVITGGESGPKHRPIEPEWVTSIRNQCRASNVAFFHKQWGGVRPKSNGRLLDGRTYDEMPAAWHQHFSSEATCAPTHP